MNRKIAVFTATLTLLIACKKGGSADSIAVSAVAAPSENAGGDDAPAAASAPAVVPVRAAAPAPAEPKELCSDIDTWANLANEDASAIASVQPEVKRYNRTHTSATSIATHLFDVAKNARTRAADIRSREAQLNALTVSKSETDLRDRLAKAYEATANLNDRLAQATGNIEVRALTKVFMVIPDFQAIMNREVKAIRDGCAAVGREQ